MLPAFVWGLRQLFGTASSSTERGNFSTPPAVDSSQDRFDDAYLPPAPAHSRLPTGSSLDRRYSLFLPRPRADPAAYTRMPSPSMQPQHELSRRGARLEPEDMKNSRPHYRSPRDAVTVGIHIPSDSPSSNSTSRPKKPGSHGVHVPRNTLSHASPHAAARLDISEPSHENFRLKDAHYQPLHVEPSRGENVRATKSSPGFPDGNLTIPRKRQKTSHQRSSPTPVVDLTDEDPLPKCPSGRRTSTQESVSHGNFFKQFTTSQSNGSAHSGQATGAFVLETYETVESRMSAKDYGNSKSSSNGLSHERPKATHLTTDLPKNHRGHSAHDVESSFDKSQKERFVMDTLLESIPTGSTQQPVKKKLMGQILSPGLRHSALDDDELAQDQLHETSSAHRLPFASHGKSGRGQNADFGIRASAPDPPRHGRKNLNISHPLDDDGSADELQEMLPPRKQRETAIREMDTAEHAQTRSLYFNNSPKANRDPSQSRCSPGSDAGVSKADIKPSNFTSSKGTKSSQKASRRSDPKETRWPLKTFKMPKVPEISGPNVELVHKPEQKRFLVHSGRVTVPIGMDIASVDSSMINRIICGTDKSTKVLLTGPLVNFQKYQRFLEFFDTQDRDDFVSFLSPIKSYPRPGETMDKIFANADHEVRENSPSRTVDAGQEEALLESRGNRSRQEAVERSGNKERTYDKGPTNATTTGKPHSNNKLRLQMQTDPPQPEIETRTSRAMGPTDVLEVPAIRTPINVRNTRSKDRPERPDEPIQYVQQIEDTPEPEIQWPPVEFPSIWKHPLVYPPTGRQRAQVEWEDLSKLDDGEFLNDSIIAFYMTWASKEAEKRGSLPPNKVYWFNTYFYSTLTKAFRGQKGVNYEGVQRWTSKVDIFMYDYVVVPINEDQHWYLAIICNLPALVRRIESGKEDEQEEAKTKLKDLPKGGLAARVHEVLSDKPTAPSDPAQEGGNQGDPMEVDIAIRNEGQVGLDKPERELDSIESAESQRPSTPQPKTGTDSHSPIQLDEDKEESKLSPNGQEDASKVSPGGKKGRKKPTASLRKFDTDQPVIIMLDSLGLAHTKTARNLKEYLVKEGKSKRGLEIDLKNFQGMTAKEIPLQDNFCDCGIFVCLYFEKFINEPETFVHKILRREMDAEKDWPDMNPPKTRRDIVALLTQLEQEQERERREQRKKRLEEKKKKKKKGEKVPVEDPGTSSVSKQSSPAKIDPEPQAERQEGGQEALPEVRPEAPHEAPQDACPEASSSLEASTEVKQQTSPPSLHPRSHGPQLLVEVARLLDKDFPHPHRPTDRGTPPQIKGIPKPEAHPPSPNARKRKVSPLDHEGQDRATDFDAQHPVQSVEEMEGVEPAQVDDDEPMRDGKDGSFEYEQLADVETIPDSQQQPQPGSEAKAKAAHEKWEAQQTMDQQQQQKKTKKKKKKQGAVEVIELDDSQP